jgi:hypothetical protein
MASEYTGHPPLVDKAKIAKRVAAPDGFCPPPSYMRYGAVYHIVKFAENRGQFRHTVLPQHAVVEARMGGDRDFFACVFVPLHIPTRHRSGGVQHGDPYDRKSGVLAAAP